jgi:RNA polymerase sigma-70 factor (ECF subfamily)
MARWASPDLVSASLSGDEAAAVRLVTVVWPGCFRLSATVTGDLGLAQDVAQETCVIILRKIRSLRNPGAFDAWLYRIVMRESARARRRQGYLRQPLHEQSPDLFDTAALDVWRALALLPDALRDVTVLFYFDGLTSAEIANALGLVHATVRTRLSRAREVLRGQLNDYNMQVQPVVVEVKQHA